MLVLQGSRRRRPRSFVVLVGVMATVLALAACGSSSKPKATTTTTGAPTPGGGTAAQSTELGQGVTANSVKLGIVIVDYDNDVISANVDFTRGNQPKIYQAFVDDLNNKGGVAGGLKIQPVYEVYAPLGSDPPLRACTKLTDDQKVFATVGVLIDFAGAAQLCFTRQHKTILITHELSQDVVKKAPPATLLTTDTLAERAASEMLQQANTKGLLTGKKFGILAETGNKSRIDDVLKPELKKLNIPVGTAGVLTLDPSGDTTQSQAQLDSFIERWKGEKDTALFVSGLAAISKVFVQKIRKAMGDILIITDGDSSAKAAGQDAVNAGVNPNPYKGVLAYVGLTDQQQFETPSLQECVKVWETASGTKVVAPKDLKKGADGKRAEIWITVRDACSDLKFFKDIADRVGKYLNNKNWVDAVNHFGEITIVATPKASLTEGKYDASDGARLAEFDPTAGTGGDWKFIP
jgi:hypothetical protein